MLDFSLKTVVVVVVIVVVDRANANNDRSYWAITHNLRLRIEIQEWRVPTDCWLKILKHTINQPHRRGVFPVLSGIWLSR